MPAGTFNNKGLFASLQNFKNDIQNQQLEESKASELPALENNSRVLNFK